MGEQQAQGPKRVVVIDADAGERRRLQGLLSESCAPAFEVLGMAPDELVVGALQAWRLDALLLGFDGDGAGWPLLHRLRGELATVPMVVVSAGQDPELGGRLLAAGAQDHLERGELTPASLTRALLYAMARQQGSAAAEGEASRAMGAVLDQIPLGVILLSPQGRVIFRNRRADAILGRTSCLWIDEDRHLRSVCAGTSRLEQAVAKVLHDGADADHAFALALGQAAVRPEVDTVITAVGHAPQRHGAVVFLSEPECPMEIDLDVLGDLYGLSHAEARVVAALARGRRPEEAAEELFVSLNTIRTHIKQAFRKTGTSRQSELIKLILTGPAVVVRRKGAQAVGA